MRNLIIIVCCFSVLIGLLILFFIHQTPKIGYVKSADLIYGFNGMKEAQLLQQKKSNELKSNVDSLQMELQRAVNQYNLEFLTLSKEERVAKEKILNIQQENYRRYSLDMEKAIQATDEELTQGVLNQINSFVEEYALKNGFDLILGTSNSGNILFGAEEYDVTSDLLNQLNDSYKASSK